MPMTSLTVCQCMDVSKTCVLFLFHAYQILETCVNNCYPALYEVLAKSELWIELMKMAADTSVGRVSHTAAGLGSPAQRTRALHCHDCGRASVPQSTRPPKTLYPACPCIQIDAEVRDRILTLCEDYAKVLPLQEFRESYELMLVGMGALDLLMGSWTGPFGRGV